MSIVGIFSHIETDSIILSNGMHLHSIQSVTKNNDSTNMPEHSLCVDSDANVSVVVKGKLRHLERSKTTLVPEQIPKSVQKPQYVQPKPVKKQQYVHIASGPAFGMF